MLVEPRKVRVADFFIGAGEPLTVIAGPCAIESEVHAIEMAWKIREVVVERGLHFIYKSSYVKANRLSGRSPRGPGLVRGLEILQAVREATGVPVLSDVHTPQEVPEAAAILDVLQQPAFLCRQTDLTEALASTGRPINIKKGQFLAPYDMKPIAQKALDAGNPNILLTERGACFGYNNLVSDMRSLVVLREIGFPVVFDATHSVQRPGVTGHSSGGDSEYIGALARAAVAVGIDALFLEIHENPSAAPSDSASMLRLEDLPPLLNVVTAIRAATTVALAGPDHSDRHQTGQPRI